MTTVHIPILLQPIVDALIEPFFQLPEDAPPHWIVDCTLGGGGHCSAFLERLAKEAEKRPELKCHRVLALDRDLNAISAAQERFKEEIRQGRLEIVHTPFGAAAELIRARPVLGLLADLGFSSDQIEDSSRGLSFMEDGPLDMRLDSSQGESCYALLEQVSESELEGWLREWGEERFSKRIASAILAKRELGELPKTTKGLVDIVVRAIPAFARHGRIHAATRTFQALRMAVNEELSQLQQLLDDGIPGICVGGRAAILSFHSLEDRQVKNKFKKNDAYRNLTKKPVQADEDEIRRNPRARSAKLRVVEKIC